MRLKFSTPLPALGMLLLASSLIACAPITPVAPTAAATAPAVAQTTDTYRDPFAYCAAVDTIDAPDARYDGPAVPDVIATTLRDDVFETPDTPLEVYQRGTYWRCMERVVYACNVGANLPCLEKADTSTVPSQGMSDFCAQNADSDFIPAYVTGRATVYEWACEGTTPIAGAPTSAVDSQGYLADYWHPIQPDSAP